MTQNNKTRIDCGCNGCLLPSLEYSDGKIIIYNEHRGVKHINQIPLEEVIRLASDDFLQKLLKYKATNQNNSLED